MERLLRRAALGLVAASVALGFANCGGSGGSTMPLAPTQTATPTLSAAPASIDSGLNATPAAVALQSNVHLQGFKPVYVSDPTVVGVSAPAITGPTTATVTVFPIAQAGNASPATVTLTDDAGGTATITKTQQICGRPPSFQQSSLLLYPKPGSKNVLVNVGTLYFSVVSMSPNGTGGSLHLVVGPHGTLEGSALFSAKPPPGTPTPKPPQFGYQYFMAGTVPTLQAGIAYRTEIWNDPCQLPVLPGDFST